MKSIIDTLRESPHEGVDSPYWLILDPKQNMCCDIYELSAQIVGVFFSRKDAEDYLQCHRYNFSNRAQVFCMSGCYSNKYREFYNSITKEAK